MVKQYISILKLLPTLIGDKEKPRETYEGFFPSNDRYLSQYYYEVEESDTPRQKQLHFKNLRNIINDESRRIANRTNQRVYVENDTDPYSKKPYIIGRQYQVPHILELEFLKLSPYGNILEKEHFDFVENILYQYLLYYDRIVNFQENDTRDTMYHYRETGVNGDLYENLRPHIIEKDKDDDDFNEFVQKTILENYEELSKIKRPTKKVLENMCRRMYACRNLEELLSIAHTKVSRFGSGLESVSRADEMSNSIPLLMLYSVIAQVKRETLLSSYRGYQKIFSGYPSSLKGEMRESYSLEEYIEDNSVYNYLGDEREDKPFVYQYGSNIDRNNNFVDYQDKRMNIFIFPHIMNQVRLAYFHNNESMVVPQTLMMEFRREPWSHLVQAETVLSQRRLDWSDASC